MLSLILQGVQLLALAAIVVLLNRLLNVKVPPMVSLPEVRPQAPARDIPPALVFQAVKDPPAVALPLAAEPGAQPPQRVRLLKYNVPYGFTEEGSPAYQHAIETAYYSVQMPDGSIRGA